MFDLPIFEHNRTNVTIRSSFVLYNKLFHDGGRYHIETSPLICSENQWTGFYTITVTVMKELKASIFDYLWQKSELRLQGISKT